MHGGGNDESEGDGRDQGHFSTLEAGEKEVVINKSKTGGDEEKVVENGFVLDEGGNGGEVGSEGNDNKQKPDSDFNLSAVMLEFFYFHDLLLILGQGAGLVNEGSGVVLCCHENQKNFGRKNS